MPPSCMPHSCAACSCNSDPIHDGLRGHRSQCTQPRLSGALPPFFFATSPEITFELTVLCSADAGGQNLKDQRSVRNRNATLACPWGPLVPQSQKTERRLRALASLWGTSGDGALSRSG